MHIYNIQQNKNLVTDCFQFVRIWAEILSLVLILFFYTTSTLANIELGVQESVNQQLQQMSLEEKVGQLFIFGFNGKSYNSGIDQKLKNLHPGALISFSKNLGKPYQIARLNHQLQSKSVAYSHVPLLLMVDQEGGTVTRILSSPRPPSALALGLTKDPALARSVGQVTGNILRFLGFNQNLAPVADLSNPNEKNFIGSRSFGDDPLLVRKMVQSLSVGHLQSLVLPTTKHFPGHGGMIQDSHKTLPIKSITIEELKEKELIPFIPLARNPMLTATMVAHLSLPKIDPTGVPATFSKVIITDILRESLGYKGLVITDDIEMSGARSSGSVGQRAIKALIAGNDMIMVAWSYHKQKEAYNAVLTAVRNGVISEARVNESLQRILYVKQLLNLENQVSPLTMSEADFQIHFRKLLSQQAQLTHRISRLNFQATLEKNDNLRSTLVPSQRVHFFSSSYSIYKNLAESLPNKVRFTRLKRKSPSPFLSMNQKMQNELLIYHVSGVGTARIIEKAPHEIKKKIIVINTSYPGILKAPNDFQAVFSINTPNHLVGRWVGDFLIKSDLRKERIPATEPHSNFEVQKKVRQKESQSRSNSLTGNSSS